MTNANTNLKLHVSKMNDGKTLAKEKCPDCLKDVSKGAEKFLLTGLLIDKLVNGIPPAL